MKILDVELPLLFDYYGGLLTPKQQACFDLYYNQDYSLAEIGEEFQISRQAVFDTLSRAEKTLRAMEGSTGAAARDQACRRAIPRIRAAAQRLMALGPEAADLAKEIMEAADTIKE